MQLYQPVKNFCTKNFCPMQLQRGDLEHIARQDCSPFVAFALQTWQKQPNQRTPDAAIWRLVKAIMD